MALPFIEPDSYSVSVDGGDWQAPSEGSISQVRETTRPAHLGIRRHRGVLETKLGRTPWGQRFYKRIVDLGPRPHVHSHVLSYGPALGFDSRRLDPTPGSSIATTASQHHNQRTIDVEPELNNAPAPRRLEQTSHLRK